MSTGGEERSVSEDMRDTEGVEPPNLVVVGVDGSEGAELALEWAVREARMLGAPLEICCFWHLPSNLGYPAQFNYQDLADSASEVVDKALTRAGELDPDLEVSGMIERMPPAVGLALRSEHARLLVVGSRGLGGFRGLLLGSVGRYCAEHAHCPVLVIRPAKGHHLRGAM